MTKLRILHAPTEVSGQVGLSVKGCRALGHDVRAAYQTHRFTYGEQADLPLGETVWAQRLARFTSAFKVAGQYDVYHYHFLSSLLPKQMRFADVTLNRKMGGKVIVEVWGSDARIRALEEKRNPFLRDITWPRNESRIPGRLAQWSKLTSGHVIAADHYFDVFLRPYFENIHVVGQRVDTDALVPMYPDGSLPPRILHIPSNSTLKGTEHVREAVRQLTSRGHVVEYVELLNVSHDAAMRACAQADLVVDQLRLGGHGVFAVEAMALGKPVVCYIHPELLSAYPRALPIITADPTNIADVLEDWISNRPRLRKRGVESRAYAEANHDYRVVAQRLLDVYQQLP